MHKYGPLLLAGFLITFALSLMSGGASANRSIELIPLRGGRATRFTSSAVTFRGESLSLICEVTDDLTLQGRVPKVVGAAIGSMTSVSVRCRGGEVTVNRETLPWALRYSSFTGALPNIVNVQFSVFESVLITAGFGFARCKYQGNAAYIATVEAGGLITRVRYNETVGVPLADDSLSFVACDPFYFPSGSFVVEPQVRARLV